MIGLWVLLGAIGWRGDGTGVVADAQPPTSWSPTTGLCWSTPLPSWSNASPVTFGDQVCVLSEPTDVLCFGARDGRLRWRATNDHADTLSPAMRVAHEARRDYVLALEAQLKLDQAEFSRLQREVRRGAATAAGALEQLSLRIQGAQAEIAAFDAFRTDRPRSIMGWSTETPVSDGAALYVQTGNGVVSRFTAEGTRTWAVQLADAPGAMRGFSTGTAASPLLVDGVLVTAWGHLRGLDPATGAVRWTGPAWSDYGTPAVSRVAGEGLLVLPDGKVVRARDGAAVGSGLGDQWFVGPAAAGDRVWFAGGRSRDDNRNAGGITVRAWSLVSSGGRVTPTRRWEARLTAAGAWYTAPVTHDGALWLVSDSATLVALSDTDGAVRHQVDLAPRFGVATIYPSPTLVGGRLYVTSDKGTTVILDPADPNQPVGGGTLEPGRATPLFVGGRFYARGDTRLWCVGR